MASGHQQEFETARLAGQWLPSVMVRRPVGDTLGVSDLSRRGESRFA